jgi:nucleoid-associated protein YgaU
MPRFPIKSTDLYVYSREDDRLDNLAFEFYEDPRYWWVLAEANNLGKGTFAVPPGLQIRIPLPIDDLLNKLKKAEEDK